MYYYMYIDMKLKDVALNGNKKLGHDVQLHRNEAHEKIIEGES